MTMPPLKLVLGWTMIAASALYGVIGECVKHGVVSWHL